jgi:LmbE family N-acetylglucosaminyl deacetylase
LTEQEQNNVAMVIIAHPDDAEFGAAGTVALWIREGWRVYCIVVTDAAGGGPDDATDVGPGARRKIAETRKEEQRAAGKILGLKDVIFLDYADGKVQPTLELRRDLVRVLRQYRPTRVICQSPDRTWTPRLIIPRYHPDHLAVGRATLAKVREIYIMGAPVQNHWVDISATIEVKMAALFEHKSQYIGNRERFEELVRGRSAELGQKYGVAYAEEFHRAENP